MAVKEQSSFDSIYSFNKTVIGAQHIKNQIPCEDYSISYSSPDNQYHVVVVADGHGARSCFRSRYGSKFVAEITLDAFRQFADFVLQDINEQQKFYNEIFSNTKFKECTIKRITDAILAKWYDEVMLHYANNPFSPEEEQIYQTYGYDGDITHIYGTTVIAALKIKNVLILIQQGDGRCVIFHNESISQPIPWDIRCDHNVTTSVCDADAAESIRSCVLKIDESTFIACYLGSDGVEDSFRDTYEAFQGSHIIMGGVHTFYKEISCQLVQSNKESFIGGLEDWLLSFSENGVWGCCGSGDDVSIAGIVNIDSVKRKVNAYRKDIRQYALEEKLIDKKRELGSKERKHGILKKRMNDAKKCFEDALVQKQIIENNLNMLVVECNTLENKVKILIENSNVIDMRLSEHNVYKMEYHTSRRFHFYRTYIVNSAIKKIHMYQNNIEKKRIELEEENKSVLDSKNKWEEAKVTYKKYDDKYQRIYSEIIELEKQITTLCNE